MEKRILFASHYVDGLKRAWGYWGFQVYESEKNLEDSNKEQTVDYILDYKSRYDISVCFSINFYPDLAEACHELEIDYINWSWDCPQASLWHKAARYDGNYIFVFDYKQYERLSGRGLNAYYLPLSSDIDTFEQYIRKDGGASRTKWQTDVSFIGNFYNDAKHRLYDEIIYLPPYLRGYLEALMTAQRKMWGVDLISQSISEQVMDLLKRYVKWDLGGRYEEGVFEVLMENMIGQKITQTERMEACGYLARKFDFRLYTGSDTSFDPFISNYGYADYLTQMPLIFHYSRINIHIQSRSIPSGISLRILDVLACEGFLLTNYQPEIGEYFTDGEELVVYYDFEDMYDKIRYYLSHEEERKEIAHAGYLKVKEEFNYIKGVEKILQVWGDQRYGKSYHRI